jgi:outer membrane protein
MQRIKLFIAGGAFLLFVHQGLFAQSAADSIRGRAVDSNRRVAIDSNMKSAADTGAFYNLQQCIDSAIRNNVTVKTFDFARETAGVNLTQQKGLLLPTLTGSANYYNNGGKSVNNFTNTYVTENYNQGVGQLYGGLTLWNGSSVRNYIRQYALAYQADKMDWQQAKDQVTINVILAYLSVLSGEEQLSLAQKQVAANRRRVELMEIQDKEGAIAPIDLTDMKGQLNASELTVVNTMNTLEASKLALAQYMNIPYTPYLKLARLNDDLTPMLYNASIDQIYQNAAKNLALVKAADLHVASADKAVKANRGIMLPTLSFQYYVTTNYSTAASSNQLVNTTFGPDGSYVTVNGNQVPVFAPQGNFINPAIPFNTQFKNNVYTQVGLNLNIPILNRLSLRTLYNQSKVNLAQAEFNKKSVVTSLRQAVESNYVTMVSAFRAFNVLTSQVENYRESFRGAEIKYDAGALKSLDFIIYTTNKDQAELNLIAAKYSYILQTKILDYYQGQLTW